MGFVVIFRIPEEKWLTLQDTPQATPHDAPQVEQLLEICPAIIPARDAR